MKYKELKKDLKLKKNNRCFIDVDFYLLKIQRNKYYWMNMKMELL